MMSVLKSNFSFLFPYLLFVSGGSIVLLLSSKSNLHLAINSFHYRYFDVFFSNITYLGDGITAISVTIILIFVKYRYALIVGLSFSISSLVTQLLKHTIFNEMVRPKKFFEGIENLHFVPGVENHLLNSFPSGHSTTAFSLYFSLALITTNNHLKLFLFAIALTVGFSRVYLSQHFFEDIYAGSIIGTVVAFFVYLSLQKSTKAWLNRSL